MNKQPSPRRVLLGQIATVHGIRGEVIVRTFTGRPQDIAAYGALTDATGTRSFKLTVVRATDKGIVARIDGIGDRTAAEKLRGQDLFIERSRLPATEQSEFYHSDLIGLAAMLSDGRPYGTIVAVQNFGAGDLLEIRLAGDRATELVPFSNAHVPEVRLELGTVTVVPPTLVGGDEHDDENG